MTWCMYLQSFEKIQQCVFEKTKRDGQTDGQTDGRGGGGGGGGVAISPVPGPTAPAGDNKAIRDGKYLAPPHASAWQRSSH